MRPTLFKKGATFGANATTVCGTTWGPYSFSGAGVVITRNVLDHALVLGNPAKQMGWMCGCGERLADDLECTVCNKIYKKTTEGIEANDHQWNGWIEFRPLAENVKAP